MIASVDQHSNTSWANWHLFCKRTGHGNVEAASAYVKAYLAAVGDQPDFAANGYVGMFQRLNGETRQAITALTKSYETSHAGWIALMLLMAPQIGNSR